MSCFFFSCKGKRYAQTHRALDGGNNSEAMTGLTGTHNWTQQSFAPPPTVARKYPPWSPDVRSRSKVVHFIRGLAGPRPWTLTPADPRPRTLLPTDLHPWTLTPADPRPWTLTPADPTLDPDPFRPNPGPCLPQTLTQDPDSNRPPTLDPDPFRPNPGPCLPQTLTQDPDSNRPPTLNPDPFRPNPGP